MYPKTILNFLKDLTPIVTPDPRYKKEIYIKDGRPVEVEYFDGRPVTTTIDGATYNAAGEEI